jgi:prepilin-type N-terminal cleavage/methylation domain-containing protein
LRKLKAFTLIELIIVVMIISMVSFLVFSEVVKENKKPDQLDPLNLPSTLRKMYQYSEDIEFFCIQNCRDCYIAKGRDILPFEGEINLGRHLEVHIVDKNNQLVEIEDFGRIKDQKICLRYTLYANGSTTQMILANDTAVYYLPSYFGQPKKLEDLDEAKALWIKEDYDLKDSGSYY